MFPAVHEVLQQIAIALLMALKDDGRVLPPPQSLGTYQSTYSPYESVTFELNLLYLVFACRCRWHSVAALGIAGISDIPKLTPTKVSIKELLLLHKVQQFKVDSSRHWNEIPDNIKTQNHWWRARFGAKVKSCILGIWGIDTRLAVDLATSVWV